MRGLESEMERRTVTYTTWNLAAKKAEAKSWHPLTFTSENFGPVEIEEIKVLFLYFNKITFYSGCAIRFTVWVFRFYRNTIKAL